MFWHDFCSLLTTMVYSHIEATVSLVEAVKNVESGCTEWLVVFKDWKSFVPVSTRAINQNKGGVSHVWKANLWRTSEALPQTDELRKTIIHCLKRRDVGFV